MAKKTKEEEDYANLIIESLVEEDYSPVKQKEEKKVKEEVSKEHHALSSGKYEDLFVRESKMIARKGRQVCIRSEFHDRISKIIHVIGQNEVTLASYIDNVLARHFEEYREDITESFNRHIKSFTNI